MAKRTRKPIIDPQAFAQALVARAGDRLRRERIMRLGDPETGDVFLPSGIANFPGEVWLHELGGSAPTTDADGLLGDDPRATTTGLLKPNTIPRGQQIYGTAVLVKRKAGILEVTDLAGVLATEYLDGLRERSQNSTDISEFDFGLLRPTPPPSMRVLVTGARYTIDTVVYDVGTLSSDDLSSYLTGLTAGQAKALQITLDPAAGTLAVTAGSAFTDNRDPASGISDHAALFADYPQSVVGTTFNCGWVKVYHGMQVIDLFDLYPGGEVYTKAGSAGDFDAIVTDENGDVVVDDDGNVVVGE